MLLCGKLFGCYTLPTTNGSLQIDTLSKFEYKDKIILNTNDCPFDLAENTILANNLHELKIDTLLVGYCGAGPYPQCFEFQNEKDKIDAAEEKKIKFLEYAKEYIELLKPKFFIPFAGTYILGSRFVELNKFRGIPSIPAAIKYIKKSVTSDVKGIHLQQFDIFDLKTVTIKHCKNNHNKSLDEYIHSISQKPLDYDLDNWMDEDIDELLFQSYSRFNNKAESLRFKSDTKIVIKTQCMRILFGINQSPTHIDNAYEVRDDFVEITVDQNLLLRLLKGPRFAHWNNAEIGSHLLFKRDPDVYEHNLYFCLYFFHS